jgi:hypothetical protein
MGFMGIRGLMVVVLVMLGALEALAQRTILGRTPDDKFLATFWAQQLNASNLVAGINANTPSSITFVNAVVPATVTSKTFASPNISGSAVLTNGATLLVRPTSKLLFATNSSMVMTNGATIQDDTGGRVWNFLLSPNDGLCDPCECHGEQSCVHAARDLDDESCFAIPQDGFECQYSHHRWIFFGVYQWGADSCADQSVSACADRQLSDRMVCCWGELNTITT